ncbi:MAG TPA: FAD:protein FMN transferase [Dokdonella sp.]
MDELRRARPWLGTIVEMRVDGLAQPAALAAIEAAFAEVAEVHRLMSFHERGSELSRLNRDASRHPIEVDARTFDVLQTALAIAAASDGRFDPCVAARLVEWGFLPAPVSDGAPDPAADWRDIELTASSRVRFLRPLWIDLGGIAKGYAVDRALAILRAAGAHSASVNAGGDLRRFGPRAENVRLRLTCGRTGEPIVELGDAAMASSVGRVAARRIDGRWRGVHLDGRQRRGVAARRSVSVVAPSCLIADALTKVVLADQRCATRLLRRYDAVACLYDDARGWRMLGD